MTLLLSATGFAWSACGIIAGIAGRRRALWLVLTGGLFAAAADFGHWWWLFAANVALVIVCAWLLWRGRRRRKRALRAYGAKSRALIAGLVRKAREAARPRPVLRPVPQAAGLS